MSSWVHEKLHEGFTSVSARAGDFHYSYFLWFEDCMVNICCDLSKAVVDGLAGSTCTRPLFWPSMLFAVPPCFSFQLFFLCMSKVPKFSDAIIN